MRFKREDVAYAGATSAATALIAFLIAGNFGLVRGPLTPRDLDQSPEGRVPRLQALTTLDDTTNVAVGGVISIPNIDGEQKTKDAVDTQPPSVSIDTADSPIVVALDEDAFRGSATDDMSGIDRVVVTFEGTLGGTSTAEADLVCSSKKNCTWSAGAPALLDIYQVTAVAFDRAGLSSMSETVSVTVVDPSPDDASDPDGSSGSTLEERAAAVLETVRTLGGVVGGSGL